jgi:hypothetical protein
MVSKARLDLPARQAGDDRQALARNLDVDPLEVVLASAADGNMRQHSMRLFQLCSKVNQLPAIVNERWVEEAGIASRGCSCEAESRPIRSERKGIRMNNLRNLVFSLAALGFGSATTASAQTEPERAAAIAAWQGLAYTDLDAAHSLIRENHPGAAPQLGDTEFQNRLRDAYAQARGRIDEVKGYNGYRAVLLGFATALGDKHIWSGSGLKRTSYSLPGFVPALRGGRWVVVEELWPTANEPLAGAEIVSCDGVAIDEIARQRLGGFRAVWDVPAQRIAKSPWLLINDIPFVERPKACVFKHNGATRQHELRWGGMNAGPLEDRLWAAVKTGEPGHEVRQFSNGWWIGLQDLSDKAEAVVTSARARAEEIRRAPMVVIDLRGNFGGDSRYGRELAEVIYGSDRVQRRLGREGTNSCGDAWRASPGNLQRVEQILSQRKEENAEPIRKIRDAIQAAIERGAAFSAPVNCPARQKTVQQIERPRPLSGPRVILITDHACFSSCLLVADYFRRLGALHVGDSTDAATRYMEVREVQLPSQISTFSTLQKVDLDTPDQVGPYIPHRPFEGDISDTAALEAWIVSLPAT